MLDRGDKIFIGVILLLILGCVSTCTAGIVQDVTFSKKCRAEGGIVRFEKYEADRCLRPEAVARDEIEIK